MARQMQRSRTVRWSIWLRTRPKCGWMQATIRAGAAVVARAITSFEERTPEPLLFYVCGMLKTKDAVGFSSALADGAPCLLQLRSMFDEASRGRCDLSTPRGRGLDAQAPLIVSTEAVKCRFRPGTAGAPPMYEGRRVLSAVRSP